MAVPTSRSGVTKTVLLHPTKQWRQQRETSPDRTVVWTEPPHNSNKLIIKRVPVLYYLSRNGHLDHPHFMEVPLSSPHGLFLTDVMNRLDILRGRGMASMYSWSCKRSYKNGFVWHDLSEKDFIHPAHGHEYVLKGSELPAANAFLDMNSPSPPRRKQPTPPLLPPPEGQTTDGDDQDYHGAADRRRRNQSCSSMDFEYNVYKAESSRRSGTADASTQTDETRRRHRRMPQPKIVPEEENGGKEPNRDETEIEISPPPSDSSPETLETLMKTEGRVSLRPVTVAVDPTGRRDVRHIQRYRSSVLMQLIWCGPMSFKDCGAGQGAAGLIGQYRMRVPRGGGRAESGRGKVEEREYFSGSLVETKREELIPGLKRSTSCNAGWSPQLELLEKEIEGTRAKCLSRKPKAHQYR